MDYAILYVYIRMKQKYVSQGFTLIELMIVMIILGILATIGFTSFQNSQKKGRDGRRKNDLRQISLALETYYNDYGRYPSGDANGKILGCGASGTPTLCDWGLIFKHTTGPTYMIKLPKDPKGNWYYWYKSATSNYKLYARLENSDDPEYVSAGFGGSSPECSSGLVCTYGISSSNTTP